MYLAPPLPCNAGNTSPPRDFRRAVHHRGNARHQPPISQVFGHERQDFGELKLPTVAEHRPAALQNACRNPCSIPEHWNRSIVVRGVSEYQLHRFVVDVGGKFSKVAKAKTPLFGAENDRPIKLRFVLSFDGPA